MPLSELRRTGHWPTLLAAFLYFDVSFMVWTLLGPLGVQIGESLGLSAQQKGLMVAVPILAGAVLRVVLGLAVDRFGAKATGIAAQLVVIGGLSVAALHGLASFHATLLMGVVLGFAGASFAVALPQAGGWYPPGMQGMVMGIAGAGNVGTVLDALLAPRLAAAYGWRTVFALALIPAAAVLVTYALFSRNPPARAKPRRLARYLSLLSEPDAHWFCFYYTVSFGGFVGLASSYVLYFKGDFGVPAVHAGDMAALCTCAGAMLRPVGGAIADRIGGIRSLRRFYVVGACALALAALSHSLPASLVVLVVASGALGMANGAVFQLLPQRFGGDMGVMTGLVGAGGGLGGFYLASSLGLSKGLLGSYGPGLLVFSGLCLMAGAGLSVVRVRWRTTWGAAAGARI
ncbi:MAG TPA: MFS transporter [Opitutaceae bacterium]|jgi:NNP family nitrate/nitrite transporter-like MFS transporter